MNIKELRKSKKLTQGEFAKVTGVSVSSLTAIETGKRRASPEVIAKVKKAYGVDIDAEIGAAAKKSGKQAAKKAATGKKSEVFIQSPLGGVITPDEILAKVGKVDKVYVRVDQNRAYWVKGKENGSVSLW